MQQQHIYISSFANNNTFLRTGITQQAWRKFGKKIYKNLDSVATELLDCVLLAYDAAQNFSSL
jgi:hypothetical protein